MADTSESNEQPELTNDELRAKIDAIGQKFNNENFDLNALYRGHELTVALQGNSLALLLIKKNVITQEEADRHFYELMLERFEEFERDILPQIRQQRIRERLAQDGQVENGMKRILGADGKPLF